MANTVKSLNLASGTMRLLPFALLLLVAPVAAQTPQLSMDVEIHDPAGEATGPLFNDTHAIQFEVFIDCGPFNPDLGVGYVLEFTYNTTSNLNATGPEGDNPPTGMCAQGGGWSGTYDVTFDVDRRYTGIDVPEAAFNVTVHMTTSNTQLAPAADDVTKGASWFIVTEQAEEAAKEPPVPQEQTTPGPALPLIAGALALAALRRRD